MKVSWGDYNNNKSNNSSNPSNSSRGNEPYVGYFSLKEGQEAIVRVMEDDPNSIDILACHWANVGGRDRWVNCPRSPKDPVDKCPLCASEKPIAYRAFIRVIQYVEDENGNIKGLAKVWDRPASFISIIQDRISDYGPLSNIICKVKRHGSGTSTTYDLMPQPSIKYPDNIYVRNDKAFENYSPLGHSVVDSSFENFSNSSSSKEENKFEGNYSKEGVSTSKDYKSVSQPSPNNWASENSTSRGYRGTPQTLGREETSSSSVNNSFSRPKRFY